MILVLAADSDVDAARFVREWNAPRLQLLTPLDLSTPHWLHAMHHGDTNRFGASGKSFATHDVSGVVILLPGIRETDLPQIVPEDRAYVAAEMNAFLFFWLNELQCSVINKPQAGSLMGPAWNFERWRWEACAAGFSLGTGAITTENIRNISVVGDQVYGSATPDAQKAALQLARSANTYLLTVMLIDNQFLYAHPRPQLKDEQVADAVRALIDRQTS